MNIKGQLRELQVYQYIWSEGREPGVRLGQLERQVRTKWWASLNVKLFMF